MRSVRPCGGGGEEEGVKLASTPRISCTSLILRVTNVGFSGTEQIKKFAVAQTILQSLWLPGAVMRRGLKSFVALQAVARSARLRLGVKVELRRVPPSPLEFSPTPLHYTWSLRM